MLTGAEFKDSLRSFLRFSLPSLLGSEKGSGGQLEGEFLTFPAYYQDCPLAPIQIPDKTKLVS